MSSEGDTPSVETLYVGTMLAFMTMRALSINLAQHFVAAETDVPRAIAETRAGREVDWPAYRELVESLIAGSLETLDAGEGDTDVTDLEPEDYDRDLARAVALDMVQRAIELLRMAAFAT